MLRFILGKCGSGKTTCIYDKICELVKNGNDKIILIVPDQSSFETEKAFLDLLGAKNSKKVLIFGFSRLCRYVFEMTGSFSKNVLDNGTRAMLMSLALEQLTEKLNLLKCSHNKSIVDAMLQTVTDLKKCSVASDDLRMAAQNITNDTLKTKLYETALVSDTFDALVSQSYIDPLDDLTRLYNILTENKIFSGYTVFYDGFSGFTIQQLKVIRVLLSQCLDTYISLTIDPMTDAAEDVFATSNHTYKTLKEYAKRDGIDIKSPIKTELSVRFKSNELKMLESGIFRKDYEAVHDTVHDIMLYSAFDIYAECEFVARQIKNLVINKRYLYSDISIICHDTSPYRGILNEVLSKYDIPYFMDTEADIEVKPVIRLVNSLFRVILNGFERDDVISLLKSGLTSNNIDEISIFENYVFVWNINNSGFKSEFTFNPKGFSEKFTKSDENNLKVAEKVRKSVVEPLTAFMNDSKNKDGSEISKLLYNLLTQLGVPAALKTMYEKFEKANIKSVGAEQIKIWNMFVDILDKMVAVLGTTPLSLKRYYELLCFQISAMKLSQIPQTMDSVTVTTAQRVRISKQRASFLIGCTDGVFPAAPHSSGIFSCFELKLLALSEISLSEDFSDIADLETFMAYCCMTSPSEKLYISYLVSDLQGNSYNPSVIVTETQKIFPNIILLDAFDFIPEKESMYAVKPAFEELAKSLSNSKYGLNGLSEYFEDDENYSSKLSAVKRARDNQPFIINNGQIAEKLFGSDLKISASQLEKFNLCRFSYFCNYGLNIKERRKAEINPMEYGTLIHYILEKFFLKFTKNEYSSMTENTIKSFVTEILNSYVIKCFGGEESKTMSFLYSLEVLNSNVCVLLKHIVDEMSQSDFEVADCELKIGSDIPAYTLKLSEKHKIQVYGSVDRVDIMEKNGVRYLRVIDYKTGPKKFKLSDILYGINLQMLLYLCSIYKKGHSRYGDIIPAGILYMPASVPSISADKNTDDKKILGELNKELKMNGFLLNDTEAISGMDKTESGKYIPVKIKLGTPISAGSLATLEEFGKIFKKIDRIIANMGKDLYGGKIQAAPVQGAHDACKYCPYDSICAYHKSDSIITFDVNNEEVLCRITEELAQEGEMSNV